MQIAPGIHSIAWHKGGRVHAYLIDEPTGFILVDTGYDGDAQPIIDEIKAIGSKKPLMAIALTHAHKSHVSGAALLREKFCVSVYASEWEIPIVRGLQKAIPVGYDFPKPFSLAALEVYTLQVALNNGIGSHKPCEVDTRIKEGMKVGPLEVIAAPGHTPGSMAFWWPERKVLFAGDSIATWPTFDAGWRTFNLDDAAQARTIGKLAELQPEIICCGHGDPITEGAADKLRGLVR